MAYLNYVTMELIHGNLTTYEMRIGKEKLQPKEATFKVLKNTKEHRYQQECFSCKSNLELTQFSGKLKCGSSKYTFKCLHYGRVGIFSFKCPYKGDLEKDKAQKYQKNK